METFANKKIKNCDIENSQKPFECIQDYLSSNINCSGFWEKNNTKPVCQKAEDYRTYMKHYMNLLKMSPKEKLAKFDCLKPNCMDFHWRAKRLGSMPDFSGITLTILSILDKSVNNILKRSKSNSFLFFIG